MHAIHCEAVVIPSAYLSTCYFTLRYSQCQQCSVASVHSACCTCMPLYSLIYLVPDLQNAAMLRLF